MFVNEKFTTKVCHAQFSNPNAANQKDDYQYHYSNYYYQYKDVCRKKRMRLKGNACIDGWKFKKQKLFCLDRDGTIKSPSNSCQEKECRKVRNPRLRVCENGCQSTCSVPHLDLDGIIMVFDCLIRIYSRSQPPIPV